MTLQSHVSTCRKQGFARIPNVFTQEEVNKMRAEALLALTKQPQVEVLRGFPTIMYHPPSKYLQGLQYDKRLTDIVQEYFESPFVLETQQWYFHLPGDPDEFAWHTDERFRPGVANLYLQTAILIDDWTEDNSAVEFIPGSHKRPFTNGGDLRNFIRGDRRGTKLMGKAGDVLTWSNTVVHGSERNQSQQSRQYFMHGFRSTNDINSNC